MLIVTVMNGRHGMTMTGIRNGSVLLMIGLVTGLGPMLTGATGPGMQDCGVLSSRVRMHLQVRRALLMSRRTPRRVSQLRM